MVSRRCGVSCCIYLIYKQQEWVYHRSFQPNISKNSTANQHHQTMRFLPLLLNLATLALAGSRTTAPSGALTVGAGQKYSSISKAVSALSLTSTTEQTIFIHPGTYQEQVYIPKLNGPLTVYGYTKDDTSYTANQVTIVASESQKSQPNNDATATLRVWTSDFKLYNVNVKNAFGQGSQAVAVSAAAGVSLPVFLATQHIHRNFNRRNVHTDHPSNSNKGTTAAPSSATKTRCSPTRARKSTPKPISRAPRTSSSGSARRPGSSSAPSASWPRPKAG